MACPPISDGEHRQRTRLFAQPAKPGLRRRALIYNDRPGELVDRPDGVLDSPKSCDRRPRRRAL